MMIELIVAGSVCALSLIGNVWAARRMHQMKRLFKDYECALESYRCRNRELCRHIETKELEGD